MLWTLCCFVRCDAFEKILGRIQIHLPDFDRTGLSILQEIAALDWGSIEPSILGTLFERSLDPAKRSQLGAHYTSREDILLLVEPVLMAPLRRR
jgi:hypothetical protein